MKLEICIAIAMNLFGGKGDLAKDILVGRGGKQRHDEEDNTCEQNAGGDCTPSFLPQRSKMCQAGIRTNGVICG